MTNGGLVTGLRREGRVGGDWGRQGSKDRFVDYGLLCRRWERDEGTDGMRTRWANRTGRLVDDRFC